MGEVGFLRIHVCSPIKAREQWEGPGSWESEYGQRLRAYQEG